MGDHLWVGKPSRYVTSHYLGDYFFRPSRVGKSSTGWSGWG